jgi:hypothetical protein
MHIAEGGINTDAISAEGFIVNLSLVIINDLRSCISFLPCSHQRRSRQLELDFQITCQNYLAPDVTINRIIYIKLEHTTLPG